MKSNIPTLAECEKALGEKAETWVGRCFEISFRIVKAGLVKGEAVYGHWLGPVHHDSHFADRGTLPFVQHGWILFEDGRVLDPTRWVFEAKTPYLYVGDLSDDYDEGGDQWRGAMGRPAPVPEPDVPRRVFPVSPDVAVFVAALLGQADGTKLAQVQIFWLANLPYQVVAQACGGRAVKEIYEAIRACDVIAFIPIDNQNRARREFGFDPGR